jgi:hypothetical protein
MERTVVAIVGMAAEAQREGATGRVIPSAANVQ